MADNLFAVDIDHTIANTKQIPDEYIRILAPIKKISYEDIKNSIATIKDAEGKYTLTRLMEELLQDIENRERILEEVVSSVYNIPYENFYYEGVVEALTQLQALGRIVIFSQGEDPIQIKKIAPLLKKGFFTNEDIFIYSDKLAVMGAFVAKFHTYQKFLFDDHIRYLHAFANADSTAVTILVQTEEIADIRDTTVNFTPTFTVTSLLAGVQKVKELRVV